jgi:hypothetical protein
MYWILKIIFQWLTMLQQREFAIMLAVGNIYVLDFMINICKYPRFGLEYVH